MKFKTYLINLALALSISLGALTTTNVNANNYAIACNSCDDAAKKQKLQQHLDSGFPQGQYTFLVIDIVGGNAREFKADVPYQDFGEFGAWSAPAIVSQQYRADQSALDKSVADVRDAIENIEEAYEIVTAQKIIVPESSSYTSAYSAMKRQEHFNAYMNNYLNGENTIISSIRDGKIKLEILSESMQVGISHIVSLSLTINQKTTTIVEFADGTTLKIILSLEKKIGDGMQVAVQVTIQGKDKDGNHLPTDADGLPYYSNGAGGINTTALASYFQSLGVKIVYGTGTHLGGSGGSCETRWKCSADGKTCTLEVISTSC